jgi:branched-chain amino acid aminotransferase
MHASATQRAVRRTIMAMGSGMAFVDGEFVPTDEASVSIMDFGFERSDVVYDTTSTWKGLFFRLEDHVARFLRSCEGIRLRCPHSRDEIKRILAEVTQRGGLQDAYVRCALTGGYYTSDRVLDFRETRPIFLAYAVPYVWICDPEQQTTTGLHAHIAQTRRIPDEAVNQSFKNHHWGDLTQAQLEARDAGAHIAVLLGTTGNLTESIGSNVFWWKGGRLFTPATNCLPGITRMTVFDLAKEMGVDVETGDYPGDALREADEAFLSSTAGGIMPVTSVDGRPLRDGNLGQQTLALRDLYWSKREAGWLGTPITDLIGDE